jgi:hypothetical protein
MNDIMKFMRDKFKMACIYVRDSKTFEKIMHPKISDVCARAICRKSKVSQADRITDMKDSFWRTKIEEQSEMNQAEIQQLRRKMNEFQEYAKEIVEIKKKFEYSKTRYHGVLDIWKNDLDAIFSVAERLTK